jgi:hypothetical protein
MFAPEYKITTVQPQIQTQTYTVGGHSFYSSYTNDSGEYCCKCSDDDKRFCSCICTTCIAIGVSIILIKFL